MQGSSTLSVYALCSWLNGNSVDCVFKIEGTDLEWAVKQGVDLHTSTLNQALAAEYLTGGHLERHLPNILEIYSPRQEAMLAALDRHFPDGFRWSKPEGGMFLWAEGPRGLDMEQVYWKAVERNVAFVPGKFFFTGKDEGLGTMRLNCTMVSR